MALQVSAPMTRLDEPAILIEVGGSSLNTFHYSATTENEKDSK